MSKYESFSADRLEELFASYLISVWSYSGVSSFSRNPKAFEKEYIYRERWKQSASTIAGKAYHKALALFFTNLKMGKSTSLVEMERAMYHEIDRVPPNEWKIQKTTPSIEECVLSATKTANALIANFEKGKSIYLDEITEVLSVEEECVEWLTINGVDVPLPCRSYQDAVVRLDSGEIAIIDHKSVGAFTSDKDSAFSRSQQAITYVKSIEKKTGLTVNEVWFVENKYSQNRDGSPQLKLIRITLDKDTRTLYEALLYEPLKCMIEAVSDPDHIFTINYSDNFIDRAELFEFWMRTMIAEVDDFNIPENKRDIIVKRQKKIRNAQLSAVNPSVISKFKKHASEFISFDLSSENMTNKEKIEHRLRAFNIPVEVKYEIKGYSCTSYLLEVSAGTKIANVAKYKLDIANALDVPSIRIPEKLVKYEGKTFLSIEATKKRTSDLLFDSKYLQDERIPIGLDNLGNTIVWDLNNPSTPHALVCGSTGSGKSVCISSTIEYARLAGIKDIIIFDPKNEFTGYAKSGISVFGDIEDIEEQMKLLVEEMQARVLSSKSQRTLVIFDEFADAVAMARSGKELDIVEEVIVGGKQVLGEDMQVYNLARKENRTTGRLKSLEENLKILLQKGRSTGLRIMAATQRASVKVITGDAKVNFPVLICFRVPREIDSKVALDESGAESLSGAGDGLISSPEYTETTRFQGFYKK